MPCGAHFPSSKKKQLSLGLESAGRKEMELLQGTTGQLQEKGQPSAFACGQSLFRLPTVVHEGQGSK